MPPAFSTSADATAIRAFRYSVNSPAIALNVTRHADHPVLAAVAERAELISVLSRQGGMLTRAAYLIKANRQPFATVQLPARAVLWGCLVGGKSVKPAKGADEALMIPLNERMDSEKGTFFL